MTETEGGRCLASNCEIGLCQNCQKEENELKLTVKREILDILGDTCEIFYPML